MGLSVISVLKLDVLCLMDSLKKINKKFKNEHLLNVPVFIKKNWHFHYVLMRALSEKRMHILGRLLPLRSN